MGQAKTAHQKRIYKFYIDLCQDVFGQTPSKSPKVEKSEVVKEEEPALAPAPVPAPKITTSVPVPETAIPGIMRALCHAGTVGIVHGSIE